MRLWSRLLSSLLVALSLTTGAGVVLAQAPTCLVTAFSETTRTQGPCELLSRSARVAVPGRDKDAVSIAATDAHCGTLRLEHWATLQRDALDMCHGAAADEMSLDMAEDVTVLASHGDFVSLRHESHGYAGGAHPYAWIGTRTWDTATGRRVRLRDALPHWHAEALAEVSAAFEADLDEAGLYHFDENAFAIVTGDDGRAALHFSFSHDVEVIRGMTWEYTVDLPAGIEPARALPEVVLWRALRSWWRGAW